MNPAVTPGVTTASSTSSRTTDSIVANSSVSCGLVSDAPANTRSSRTLGSSMTRVSSASKESGSTPGSRRQSIVASARPGMTLCFIPAVAVVALIVFVSRARTRTSVAAVCSSCLSDVPPP